MDPQFPTKRVFTLLVALVLSVPSAFSQNVGINSDGSTPGMTLDVKPTGASDGVRINNAAGGTGDPVVNFQIDDTDEFTIGVDDSNGDRLKIDNGGALGTSPIISIESGGDVGININNPNDELDVGGNAQVSGYLRVGNPATPTALTAERTNLFSTSLNEMDGGLEIEATCGFTFWQFIFTDSTQKNYMSFDNIGLNTTTKLYTPFIWVPTGAGDVQFMFTHDCNDLEAGFDGVYMEYYDGGTWVKIENADGVFGIGYPGTADMSTDLCGVATPEDAFSGNLGFGLSIYSITTLDGEWTRFRFVGSEDGSDGTGDFKLFHISVDADLPAHGGAFASGNIYSENNIYAGSNVMLGDLAEYFPVVGNSEPGDVISMVDGAGEQYITCSTPYDSKVIGIYSSAPTLTLNDPSSGVPVGLQGRVPVKVTNQNGPIKKGDYLTASFKRGHAMKADKACYIVGRALEDFDQSTGKILCLIETGWYNPIEANGDVTASRSGEFKIMGGTSNVKVVDPAVQDGSRILVTMMGDPGHRYWVNNVGDGSFDLELSGDAAGTVPFVYLVDNANIEAATDAEEELTASANTPVPGSKEDWNAYTYNKETNEATYNGQPIDPREIPWFRHQLPPGARIIELPQYTGGTPPEVEDPAGRYTWSTSTGLVPVGLGMGQR